MSLFDLNFRKKPSMFLELFNDLITWGENEEAFTYNEITTVIDYKVKYVDNININQVGNYYVTTDNKIYDNNKVELLQINIHDKFTIGSYHYFLNDELGLREISDKWNNTYFGQWGITIKFGEPIDENIMECPLFHFVYDEEDNMSPFERDYTTIEKTLLFYIVYIVDVNDVFETDINYNISDYYFDKINELIYIYFNTCNTAQSASRRLTDWRQRNKIISEDNPTIKSSVENTLTYI